MHDICRLARNLLVPVHETITQQTLAPAAGGCISHTWADGDRVRDFKSYAMSSSDFIGKTANIRMTKEGIHMCTERYVNKHAYKYIYI